MGVSLNRLFAYSKNKTSISLEKLKKQIIELRDQLNCPEKQSFYFRKGIKSMWSKYNHLLTKYKEIRQIINSNDLSYFEEKLKEEKKILSRININSSLHFIFYRRTLGSIYQYEELIRIKKKYGDLKEISK